MTSVQQIMVAKQWLLSQSYVQHYIFNVFVSCLCSGDQQVTYNKKDNTLNHAGLL